MKLGVTTPTDDSVVYTEEASTLHWPLGRFMPSFRLYGTSFIHVRTERDADGDVKYWLYWSNSIRKHAKIFND